MTNFVFDAAVFVPPGFETDPGEWSESDRRDIAKLRSFYPELAHWGDLALGGAFGAMSRDVLSVSWGDWLLEARDEMFLGTAAGVRPEERGMVGWISRRSIAWIGSEPDLPV